MEELISRLLGLSQALLTLCKLLRGGAADHIDDVTMAISVACITPETRKEFSKVKAAKLFRQVAGHLLLATAELPNTSNAMSAEFRAAFWVIRDQLKELSQVSGLGHWFSPVLQDKFVLDRGEVLTENTLHAAIDALACAFQMAAKDAGYVHVPSGRHRRVIDDSAVGC